MERRPYGPSGRMVSIVAFGGVVVKNRQPEEAARLVHRAFDRGVNYFDVAPLYGDPEVLMGPALAELPRDEFFLACKTTQRRAAKARADLDESLRRLKVDYLDLYQFHGVSGLEDVETIFAPGGAMEVFERARDEGLVRHLGFSAHDEEAGISMLERFDFASALFPVNWVSLLSGSFGPRLLAACREKGASALALKAMARTAWEAERDPRYPNLWYRPETDPETAALALRYALSRDVTTVIPPGDEELFFLAVDTAERFEPVTEEETELLRRRAKRLAPLFPVAG